MIKNVELLPPRAPPESQPAPGPAGNGDSQLAIAPKLAAITGWPAGETPPLAPSLENSRKSLIPRGAYFHDPL
jgi:hypothetical protein